MEKKFTSAEEIESEIAGFPKGHITYKTIRGKKRMYLQWYENGEKKSKYIRAKEEQEVLMQVAKRKALERMLESYSHSVYGYSDIQQAGEQLTEGKYISEDEPAYGKAVYGKRSNLVIKYETSVVLGDQLTEMCSYVGGFAKRECFSDLQRYLDKAPDGRVCIIYGLRRTGKTVMVLQAISDLPVNEVAYIKVTSDDTMAELNRDLQKLYKTGIRYVFIDEVTLMEDFIDSASLLSDIYAVTGIKIVLSGTDSLGFALSVDDELYDRAYMIHTTFIPFREYSRLLGIHDVDEFIRYGGTFLVGETDFSNINEYGSGVAFRDEKSARKYIDTAIARNIQHSLACYQGGGHFRHLIALYEAGELTSAINRIIEDMNHRFLMEVLTKKFKSHDLGSARQIERKKAARNRSESILDKVDTKEITERLRGILDIKNAEERQIQILPEHVMEIKQYLFLLDLIIDCPSETIGSGKAVEHIIFTQPGMRYCQAQALVHSLMQDEIFKQYPIVQRRAICDSILKEVRGRMLEEIVLEETVKALPKGMKAFKLEFEVGEFDMVIWDENKLTCELFEIKHSDIATEEQCKHLKDSHKCEQVEFQYGEIVGKTVLYRGEDEEIDGVSYKNVVKYLENLRN
ncbi:AAA family ATPase [Butyrivibrio sp. AC2005]|uniref:AAA family ATPase n=1 Tax=Butyrivibrio sp. AC2005 TaxID=1280672 RepID=UPI00041BDE99|nr:AAA family ATPase [Butyrivibrio sp. AC2005]